MDAPVDDRALLDRVAQFAKDQFIAQGGMNPYAVFVTPDGEDIFLGSPGFAHPDMQTIFAHQIRLAAVLLRAERLAFASANWVLRTPKEDVETIARAQRLMAEGRCLKEIGAVETVTVVVESRLGTLRQSFPVVRPHPSFVVFEGEPETQFTPFGADPGETNEPFDNMMPPETPDIEMMRRAGEMFAYRGGELYEFAAAREAFEDMKKRIMV